MTNQPPRRPGRPAGPRGKIRIAGSGPAKGKVRAEDEAAESAAVEPVVETDQAAAGAPDDVATDDLATDEAKAADVERSLAQHFGHPVPLRLVVDEARTRPADGPSRISSPSLAMTTPRRSSPR